VVLTVLAPSPGACCARQAKHPRSAGRAKPAAQPAAAVSASHSWGGFLPKVTLPTSKAHAAKQAKQAKQAKHAAPAPVSAADSKVVATEKALQKVGVNGAALKLLASAEKSQSRDTSVPPHTPSPLCSSLCPSLC
jgi:hypothetical protein